MTVTKINTLLELITQLVKEGEPWMEQRDAILANASDDDKVNLEEFVAWFDADID